MNENQMKRESVLNRDIANVQSLSVVNAGPRPANKWSPVVLETVQVSLHLDTTTTPSSKRNKRKKKKDFMRRSLFSFFLGGGVDVCVLLTATHISQLPAQERRKNSLISCGRLSYGFRVRCPNGGERERERRPRNRWRIHATLVIYDLVP